jgi:hypothetical protein
VEYVTRKGARVAGARSYMETRSGERLDRREVTRSLIVDCGCPPREAGLLAAEYAACQRVRDAGLDPAGVSNQVDRLLFGTGI